MAIPEALGVLVRFFEKRFGSLFIGEASKSYA
jgi:hypothetical protein